jgi:hypothetical protein
LLDLQEDSERILGSDALRKVFIQRFEDHAVKKKEYDAASNVTAEGKFVFSHRWTTQTRLIKILKPQNLLI